LNSHLFAENALSETPAQMLPLRYLVGLRMISVALTSFLEDYYTGKLFKILFVELQFKMLLYFKEAPKIEISFSKKLEELYNKFYDLNFSLEKSAPYILFDKSRVGREYFKNLSIANVKMVIANYTQPPSELQRFREESKPRGETWGRLIYKL